MKYVRVKDLGQIITGNTPPTTDDSYYGDFMPFIKATDIPMGSRFTYNTEQCYSEKAFEKYKANLVPKGATCIVTIGSIGKKMTQAHTDLFVNQAINAILPFKQFDQDYVYYATKYAVLPQLKIYDSGTTSGRENISKSSFSNIRLFIEEDYLKQRKIASILSTYDNLIENNTKRIKLLEQMAENLYKEWFVRFRFPGHENVEFENGLPKGWKVEKLGDWGVTLESGSRPKGGIDDSLVGGMPSFGAEVIKGLAEFDYNSVKIVPLEFYQKLKRGKNSGNDILLYKDGAYIGKVTLFRDEFPFKEYSINEHVFFISPNDEEYKNYLYFTLHQKEYFTLMQNLNRNAAQPGLSQQDIYRVKISIPQKDLIIKLNKVINSSFASSFSVLKMSKIIKKMWHSYCIIN